MKQIVLSLSAALTLVGCAELTRVAAPPPRAPAPVVIDDVAAPPRPVRPPTTAARTAEEFDTTTAEDRAEARAVSAGGRELGTTIASLGAPTEPGFWLETPLVSEATRGRVIYGANGRSLELELRPISGAATAGSRISLAAMRLLDAPLTGLPELTVYAN